MAGYEHILDTRGSSAVKSGQMRSAASNSDAVRLTGKNCRTQAGVSVGAE
jgi:hypothetical protein